MCRNGGILTSFPNHSSNGLEQVGYSSSHQLTQAVCGVRELPRFANAGKRFMTQKPETCMPRVGSSVLLVTAHVHRMVRLCDLTMDQGQVFHCGLSRQALASRSVIGKSALQSMILGGIARDSLQISSSKMCRLSVASQRTYLLFIPK